MRLLVGVLGVIGWATAGCAPVAPPAASQPAGSSRPLRIASVTLATDEILLDLVGPDRLAAVSVYCDDPGYSNVAGRVPPAVPRIRGEIEAILGVHPDLVCVSAFNTADFLKLLERSGLRYFRHDYFRTFADIRAGILKLGAAVGEPDRARQMVRQMDERLAAVEARIAATTDRPRVLHWSGGWTSGAESTLDDMIRAAGARNAAAELGFRGPVEITTEQLLALDPDWLVVSARAEDAALSEPDAQPVLRRLRAVREGRIMRVPATALLAVSHYAVAGAEVMARHLHPECFSDPPLSGSRRP